MILRPELVVEEGRAPYWLTNDGLTASTVRELLRKYPRGTMVADYYPSGRAVTSEERGTSFRDAERKVHHQMRPDPIMRPRRIDHVAVAAARAADVVPAVRRAQTPRRNWSTKQKYDKNAVLNAWARGAETGAIAVELGMKRGAVTAMIQVARQRGDERAMKKDDPRRRVV